MKKTFWTRLTSIALCICLALPLFSGCNKDKSDNDEAEAYYSSLTAEYNANGEYKGNFALSDETDDKFIADIGAKDFTLTAFSNLEEQASAQIKNFTVTKTSDKEFKITFSSPFGYSENLRFVLMSDAAVTEKGNKIAVVIYITSPEPDIDITYTGAYRGTEKLTLTATLEEGWKFATDINAGVLTYPDGMDLSVSVARESDTKAVFTITDIPTDFSGSTIDFTLKKSAIDSEFSKDIFLNIDFKQTEITVDPSFVSYDEETKVLTVGKVTLPEGVTGKENGIKTADIVCRVSEQNYDASTNSYSFKLAYNDEYSKSSLIPDKKNYISNVKIEMTLNIDGGEIDYGFIPYNIISGIKANVQTNEEDKTLTIELVPYNATFKEGITEDDIKVAGNDGLTNFACTKVASDKIVYTADYTSDIKNGVALTFTADGTVLKTNFGLDSYSLMAYIPAFNGDRDLDWTSIGDDIVSSAVGGLGSTIGSSVAGFVLPYIYDFMEIDMSDPQINKVQDSVDKLSYAINDLTNDIGSLSNYVGVSADRTILDSFQTLETTLLTSSLKLLSDEKVVNYVSYIKKAVGDKYNEVLENEKARIGFEKFYDYYKSCYENDPDHYWQSRENMIYLYNV